MKMKKYTLGIIMGLAVFLMAACGTDPRKEFVNTMFNEKKQEYNAASFEMKLKDLTYDGDENNAYVKMIANQLKDVSLSGKYAVDEKEEAIEMEITANILGEKLPFQFVGQKEKFYMSTSFISSAVDLAKSFGYPLELGKDDLNKLKGKYIDLAKAGDSVSSGKLDKKNPLKNNSFSSEENAKLAKEMKKLVGSFDKKTFTKEKDVISHTFTKAEFIKMVEKAAEVSKNNKDTNAKDVKEMIKTFKKDIDKMDMTVNINQKTKVLDTEIAVSSKDKASNSKVGVVLTFTVKPQKNSKKINIPSKKEIISESELNKLFAATTSVGNTVNEDSEENNATTDFSMDYSAAKENPAIQEELDKQLAELIKQIEENSSVLTEESAKEMRNVAKDIFNDAQMKKLNDALDKALK